MTVRQDDYETLLDAIRKELAPVNTKLDRLESTLDAKYYNREAIDGLLREVVTRHESLKAEVLRQSQGWQTLLTRIGAWVSIAYVLLNLLQHVRLN